MDRPNSEEQRKDRAAYAAIVPFLLAEVVLLGAAFTGSEPGAAFFGIVFGVNMALALLLIVVVGGRGKRD